MALKGNLVFKGLAGFVGERSECLGVFYSTVPVLFKVQYKKEMESSATLMGKVVSQPKVVHNQQRSDEHLTGRFTLGYLTQNQERNYCQVEAKGDGARQVQASIREGDVIVIQGQIQSILDKQIRIFATKMAHVVSPPDVYADISLSYSNQVVEAQEEYVPVDTAGKWQHLREHPEQWWDMRDENQHFPVKPAFKHKRVQGRALWVDGIHSNHNLKELQESDQVPDKFPGWSMLIAQPEEFWDHRKIRKSDKSPSFVHKATRVALWIVVEQEVPEIQEFCKKIDDKDYMGPKPTDPWQDLLSNSGDWEDRRLHKRNKNSPDFIKRQHSQDDRSYGLWLAACPEDTRKKLMKLELEGKLKFRDRFSVSPEKLEVWKRLLEDATSWNDMRMNKLSPKYPDFVNGETGEALWLSSAPPQIVQGMKTKGWLNTNYVQVRKPFSEYLSQRELKWKEFFEDTSLWSDFRNAKTHEKHPDFKTRDGSKALWLDTKNTPNWVFDKLKSVTFKNSS